MSNSTSTAVATDSSGDDHHGWEAHEIDIAMPIAVLMRTYFSSYHLWAAQHFSALVNYAENEEDRLLRFEIKHRVYVITSIFSGIAFLEAAINELFQNIVVGG